MNSQNEKIDARSVKFLDLILPEEIGGEICAWRKSDRVSFWSKSALEIVRKSVGQSDWYMTMSRGKHGKTNQRVTKETSLGIGCIWIDIDVATGQHGKPNLPPTIEQGLGLIKEPLAPSIIIHSGGGAHVYWLLKEPLIFTTDDDRIKAEALVRAWQAFIRMRAQDHGWTVDSTHDLARLMRIPGTLNGKTNPPLKVTIEFFDEKIAYDPSDFEQYLGDAVTILSKTIPSTRFVGDITINPDAHPPMRKFTALLSVDSKIQRTYDRSRQDIKDKSASGYDMALAVFAARAGWSDQEIVDLIIASRVKAGDALHSDNPGKYKTTIATARSWAERESANENLDAMTAAGEMTDPDKRPDALVNLSKIIGGGKFSITRIVRYTSDPPEYMLETDLGAIRLGPIDGLTGQTKFRNSIAALTGVWMGPLNAIQWQNRVQQMLNVCIDVSAGEEATETGRAQSWLESYFEDHIPTMGDDLSDAITHRLPFIRNDEIHFFTTGPATAFASWIRAQMDARPGPRELGVALRRAGAEPRTVRIMERVLRVWVIKPDGFPVVLKTLYKEKKQEGEAS
jgi:hypothetical protein